MIGDPHIVLSKDGPFFRLAVLPPEALPDGFRGPSTFSSAPLARMAGKILGEATGLPVVAQMKG
jgi:hypothetical protein